nr:hypothetical protein [Tanacetum cinerariifolium]
AALDDFSKMPNLEDTGIFDDAYDDRDEGAETNYINLETMEPKKVTQALDDQSWVESMKNQRRAIGTKWIYRNKKDKRGIVVRNKARLFLAYALFKDFVVYQMDVKSAFQYGKIKYEVYVCQPLRFNDPEFPDSVYKVYVDDIIFGSTRKEMCTEFEKMMPKKFQMSSMASTPIKTSKPLLKDAEAEDADVHLYRSMIGSLMYLAASRPDIMFAVCTCTRF